LNKLGAVSGAPGQSVVSIVRDGVTLCRTSEIEKGKPDETSRQEDSDILRGGF
jgi:hypothetical protein